MVALNRIHLDGVELLVEHRQLDRYIAAGWQRVEDQVMPFNVPVLTKSGPNYVEVWRGKERRLCTVDQISMMASLGFNQGEPEEKTDGREQGNHDGGNVVPGKLGDPAGSGGEERVAGDSKPRAEADPGPHDEPPARKIARASNAEEIREAFAKLDPENDEHWTSLGSPRLEVLNALLPQGPVSRPTVNAATQNAMRPTRK